MTLLPPLSPAHASRLVEVIAGRGGPVLLSVPHSGRDYDAALLTHSRLGRASLERLEDPLVDQLVAGVIDRGAGAIIARAPRALIDVNRGLAELAPAAISGRHGEAPTARARAGLGVIPTRIAGLGELWRGPISEAEFDQRVVSIHKPYHDALAAQLALMAESWSDVLLLDCHSMPPRPEGVSIVVGDRHGTSAAPWLIDATEAIARRCGFTVARNQPYAGGHVVERHGRPKNGIHALQIEIDRSTYCQRDLRTPGPGFDRVAMLFETLASELGALLRPRLAEAAE
ncbi:MAG: N-formylglutamate amidohydrolase [Pseudomonadota bacterium]|nr:N-formylglutamate amidohydrolase [Pseudomonadota bacterium]